MMDNSSAASDDAGTGPAGGVRAVARALEILQAFREGEAELGAAVLLRRVRLTRPTLYRLLYTLERQGFVQAVGEPQRFRLGPAAGALARVWGSMPHAAPDIPTAAQPSLRRLWEATGETVAVFVREGSERICVAEIASPQALSFRRGVGHRENILLGASGRVILARSPHTAADLRAYAKGLPAGRKVDLAEYAKELERTRRRGHAVSRSELIQGAVAMAAPFFGADGGVAGSLAVFGPSVRLDAARVREICALLAEEARTLSAALAH